MPPIGAFIYQENPSQTGVGVCFRAIRRRELGNLPQSRDGCRRKSRLCGDVSLAHRLLFFIAGVCSSAIRHELDDITPIKRGGKGYEIPTGYPTYETKGS
jgi:hypothetical protein